LQISCDSESGVLDPGGGAEPEYEIAYGSALGATGFEDVNPYFFFLPPLVSNPSTSGAFDGTLADQVFVSITQCGDVGLDENGARRICADWDGKTPEDNVIGGFWGNLGDIEVVDEIYQVDWDTELLPIETNDQYPNDPFFYRLAVWFNSPNSTDPLPLGHVDVQFGATGKEIKNINEENAEFIGLKDGRTVPIKFKILEYATEFAVTFASPGWKVVRSSTAR
jgi:hypothetical protein